MSTRKVLQSRLLKFDGPPLHGLLILRRKLADRHAHLSPEDREVLRLRIVELTVQTLGAAPPRPVRRSTVPPWPEEPRLEAWLQWLSQAREDLRSPEGQCPGYRAAAAAARAYAGALKRLIALELDPWADYSRPETLPFMSLKRLRRYRKGEGRPVEDLDALIRRKRATRRAPVPGAKQRVPAEERVRWKAAERARRERARCAERCSVDRDEQGLAMLPPWPEAPAEVDQGYLDWISSVIVDLYYAGWEEHEQAAVRYQQAIELRERAEKALKPPPAEDSSTITAGDDSTPSEPPILAWAREYSGPAAFCRDGLRWIRQEAIPWFRQRERQVRAVAWRRGFVAEEAPGGLQGTYWGFPIDTQ